MQKAFDEFHEYFKSWGITVNPDDIKPGVVYQLNQRGWTIWLLVSENERGRYLDCYAAHRMTNDRHWRVYEDGTDESLPALSTMVWTTGDAEKDAERMKQYHQEQREIMQMLQDKGFVFTGSEQFANRVRRYALEKHIDESERDGEGQSAQDEDDSG